MRVYQLVVSNCHDGTVFFGCCWTVSIRPEHVLLLKADLIPEFLMCVSAGSVNLT
jgi:hypothetical protein